jgi:hypothetical protein
MILSVLVGFINKRKAYLRNKITCNFCRLNILDVKKKIIRNDDIFDRNIRVSKNRYATQQKAKMYKTICKEIEKGSYKPKAEPKYENLYQDFKEWGRAKEPFKMQIHIDNNDPANGRAVMESFSQTHAITPKFDSNTPTEYYIKRYAGGPLSNSMKISKIDIRKIESYVIIIQRRVRIYFAKKSVSNSNFILEF